MKWLALLLMTADHVNKFLLDERLPGIYETGRIVLPLFAFVLGYNLARPGALASGAYARTAMRLATCGALAELPFVAMVGWWPLNVLFTLLLGALVLWLLEAGGARRVVAAIALCVVGGALVEFWWCGALTCVAAWRYCRRPSLRRMGILIAAVGSLAVVNGNLWSLATVPVLLAAPHVDIPAPRWRSFFYPVLPGSPRRTLAAARGNAVTKQGRGRGAHSAWRSGTRLLEDGSAANSLASCQAR